MSHTYKIRNLTQVEKDLLLLALEKLPLTNEGDVKIVFRLKQSIKTQKLCHEV